MTHHCEHPASPPTSIYSLVDLQGVRNDASFEKDYIKGKYGAIPFLGNFEELFEN